MHQQDFASQQINKLIKSKMSISHGLGKSFERSVQPKFKIKNINNIVFPSNLKSQQKKTQNVNNIFILNMPIEPSLEENQNVKGLIRKRNKSIQLAKNDVPCAQSLTLLKNYQYESLQILDQNRQAYESRNNGQYALKRYNSTDIRISNTSNMARSTAIDHKFNWNYKTSVGSLMEFSPSKPLFKFRQFKPSFKQLLRKSTQNKQYKARSMSKKDFNYQRAISTAAGSRKKSFQKLMQAFQELNKQKIPIQNSFDRLNPEKQKQQVPPCPLKIVHTHRISKNITKQRISDKKGQQLPCRPWSRKKHQKSQKNLEQQNPLQFYSINQIE